LACGQIPPATEQEKGRAASFVCHFATDRQMLETTVVLTAEQLNATLVVFDFRHKMVVENITVPVRHDSGYWIFRSLAESDAVVTAREHKIRKSNLVYERNTEIKMGSTPTLQRMDQGHCRQV
jgi:hypothetical protein